MKLKERYKSPENITDRLIFIKKQIVVQEQKVLNSWGFLITSTMDSSKKQYWKYLQIQKSQLQQEIFMQYNNYETKKWL